MKIEEKVKKANPKSNLTKNETDPLQHLSQRDNIAITEGDMGGVVIDIDDYIYEANWQLFISFLTTRFLLENTKWPDRI